MTDYVYQIWCRYDEDSYNGTYHAYRVWEDSPAFRIKEDAEAEAKRLNDRETEFNAEKAEAERRLSVSRQELSKKEWDALRGAGLRQGEYPLREFELIYKTCTDYYVEKLEVR